MMHWFVMVGFAQNPTQMNNNSAEIILDFSQQCKLDTPLSFILNSGFEKSDQETAELLQVSSDFPPCMNELLKLFPYSSIPNGHSIVVKLVPGKETEHVVKLLPRLNLHYFYEANSLTLVERVNLYLYLGVVHE